MKYLFMSAFVLVFLIPMTAQAHPGGTDNSGGHHCWTDCSSWNLRTGEYHFHDEQDQVVQTYQNNEELFDKELAGQLQGRILLQVESLGEAWYVRSSDHLRYYLKDGDIAYEIMRFFSLGISSNDLERIPAVQNTTEMKESESICETNELAKQVRGEILLQVEQNGEAWYVDPEKCRRIYLQDGAAAYEVMRFLGLGITNSDLEKIPQGKLETNPSASIGYLEPDTIVNTISRTKQYYENLDSPIQMDSLFLFTVALNAADTFDNTNLENIIDPDYAQSPYIRFLDGQAVISSDLFEQTMKGSDYSDFAKAMIHALYCDTFEYTENDFANLLTFRDSGYGDTHVLSTLNMLETNDCINSEVLEQYRELISQAVADSHNGGHGDLQSEQIVSLYWAGYGNLVQESWIEQILTHQNFDLGWGAGGTSNPHNTGLSLLALIYWNEGKRNQNFFPMPQNQVSKYLEIRTAE